MRLITSWIKARAKERAQQKSKKLLLTFAERDDVELKDLRVTITELISGYSALFDLDEDAIDSLVSYGGMTELRTFFNAPDLLSESSKMINCIVLDTSPGFPIDTRKAVSPSDTLLDFFTDKSKLIDVRWYLVEVLRFLRQFNDRLNEVALCRKDFLAYWLRVCYPIIGDYYSLMLSMAKNYRNVCNSKGGGS